MSRLFGWLNADRNKTEPVMWLRVGIPVAVLMIVLFWILKIYFNDEFWAIRAAASLPVAKHQPSWRESRGSEAHFAIDPVGRLLVADRCITIEEMITLQEKVKEERSYLIPVKLRVDATTAWRVVQPVLSALRSLGYREVSFLARREDGLPTTVVVNIDAPSTNGLVTIVRKGETLTVEDISCNMEKLRSVLKQLGGLDGHCPIRLVADPDRSVQDVVDIIDMHDEFFHLAALYIAEESLTETIGSGQQGSETNTVTNPP